MPVSFHLFTLLTPRPLPHSLFDLPLIWSLTLLFPFRLLLLLLNLIFYFLILFLFLHFLLIFFHISSLFTLTLLSKYKSLFNSSVFVLLPWCFFLSFFLLYSFHVILLTSLSCCFFILLSSPNIFFPFPHICSSSPVFTFFYFLLFFSLPPRCGPSLHPHTRTLTSFPPTIWQILFFITILLAFLFSLFLKPSSSSSFTHISISVCVCDQQLTHTRTATHVQLTQQPIGCEQMDKLLTGLAAWISDG